MTMDVDTIAALSTVPGISAVAVVRVSGPDATSVLSALLPLGCGLPEERRATLVELCDPDDGSTLDYDRLLGLFRIQGFCMLRVGTFHGDLHPGCAFYDVEWYKYMLERMFAEAGVEFLYHTFFSAVIDNFKIIIVSQIALDIQKHTVNQTGTDISFAVVSVNSSMLARVPGPADLLAIEAMISA